MSKSVSSSSTSSLSSSGSELPTIPEASEVVVTANGFIKGKHSKPRDRPFKQRNHHEKGERFEGGFSRRPISSPSEQPSRFNNSHMQPPPHSYFPSVCGTYEFVGAQNSYTTYGPWPHYAAPPSDVMMIPGSLPTVSWLCACDLCVNSVQEFIGALNNTNGMYATCVQSNGPIYNEVLQSGFHFPSPVTGKLEPANGGGGDATVTSTTTAGEANKVAKGKNDSSATTTSNATPVDANAPAVTNGIGASDNAATVPVAGMPAPAATSNTVVISPPNGFGLGPPLPLFPMPMIQTNGFMGNMMPPGNMMPAGNIMQPGNMMGYYNNNYWPVNMGMPGYPAGAPMMMGAYPNPPMMNGYAVETANWTEPNNNCIAESNKNKKQNDDVNNNEVIKSKNKRAAMELKEGAVNGTVAGGESAKTAISK